MSVGEELPASYRERRCRFFGHDWRYFTGDRCCRRCYRTEPWSLEDAAFAADPQTAEAGGESRHGQVLTRDGWVDHNWPASEEGGVSLRKRPFPTQKEEGCT